MKKQEIKRRKRVIPAMPESTPAPSVQQSSLSPYSPQLQSATPPRSSVSPDPNTAMSEASDHYSLSATRGPVAIDFTNYQSNFSAPQRISPPAPSPRKRSLSAALEPDETPQMNLAPPAQNQPPIPHRPSTINSILNPHPTASVSLQQDSLIDPSLSNLPERQEVEDKSKRKERLRREAEEMREALLRKERELQEMED